MRKVAALCSAALAMALGHPDTTSAAESYPARSIRLIVASGPGGGLDFIARLIAPAVTESIGQSIVVDNRPGATGSIAAELAARATPDGYSFMLMSASLVVYGAVNKTSYDLFRDFAPVSQTTAAPYILVAALALPVQSVAQLIAYAKTNPGKLNYFSTGSASFVHLATEWFRRIAGIELVHVPYKGLGAAYPDILAGRIQIGFSSPAFAMTHLRTQTLRALAITSASRSKALPELPTMMEAGVSGFVVTQWHALVAPQGTPRTIIERMHREIARGLQQRDVSLRLAKEGLDSVGSSPAELAAHLRSEHDTWTRIIRQAGIKVR